MTEIKIIKNCTMCNGTGLWPVMSYNYEGNPVPPVNQSSCPYCNGAGEISTHRLSEDVMSVLSDILDKCNNIFEKVNE